MVKDYAKVYFYRFETIMGVLVFIMFSYILFFSL